MPKLVTHIQNIALHKEISTKEVKAVVKELLWKKAPEIDMMPAEFFQACWEDIGLYMVEFIKEVFFKGYLPKKINTSNILFIPKIRDLSLITNYQPISLLNPIYKIIAKVLANKLITNLPQSIQKSQKRFIKGTCIYDNVFLATKAMA